MLDAKKLSRSRGMCPGYLGPLCPQHISINACDALFGEAGVKPGRRAGAQLGDIIENFALELLKGGKGTMTRAQLRAKLTALVS